MEDELYIGNILAAENHSMDFDTLRLQWWQLEARLVQREISDFESSVLHPTF